MLLTRVALTDFRNYQEAVLDLPPGLLVVTGSNGSGKTNLLEAVGWLARLNSFRGAPPDAMVRRGASQAVVRGVGQRRGSEVVVETEVNPGGRGRVLVNHQAVRRSEDLAQALQVSIFSPDDLELIKGGPGQRRRFLDEALSGHHPRNAQARRDLDRVLRQRNALLRSAGGRAGPDVETTLDVWDSRLAAAGEAVAEARAGLVARLEGLVTEAYQALSGSAVEVTMGYERSWPVGQTLAEALARSRTDDLRRGLSLVGPHRDDLVLVLAGMAARLCASQGEQRTLALALRLATHHLAREINHESPLLLLDDVFSELDAERSEALVANLPPGQAILTTAGSVPQRARADHTVVLSRGRFLVGSSS